MRHTKEIQRREIHNGALGGIRVAQAFPMDAEGPRMGTQGMKENGQ